MYLVAKTHTLKLQPPKGRDRERLLNPKAMRVVTLRTLSITRVVGDTVV